MRFILPLALFALALPSRADIVLYDVTGNLSSLSGAGFLGFSLDSLGTPLNNVTATITGLTFNGGSYDFGTGDPASDVVRNGNTITFGGTGTARFYDIPVSLFGSSLGFQLALSGPGVLGTGSGDGWTFSVFAADQNDGFEYLLIDIPQSGEPAVDASSGFGANVVPEPSTYAVLALGVSALVIRARHQRRR
jgi:hypothetical protein